MTEYGTCLVHDLAGFIPGKCFVKCPIHKTLICYPSVWYKKTNTDIGNSLPQSESLGFWIRLFLDINKRKDQEEQIVGGGTVQLEDTEASMLVLMATVVERAASPSLLSLCPSSCSNDSIQFPQDGDSPLPDWHGGIFCLSFGQI